MSPSPVSLRRLQIISVVVPLGFVLGTLVLEFFLLRLMEPRPALLATASIAVAGVLSYGLLVANHLARIQQHVFELWRRSEAQAAQLEALHQAGLALQSNLDLDKVLQRVVALGRRVTGASSGMLEVYDAHGQVERLVRSGEGNPLASDRLHAVPLRHRGLVFGTLYLGGKETGSAFTPMEEEAARRLALQASLAVINARLYEQVEHMATVEERRRLAMDLHDGILQNVYAVTLRLEDTLQDIPETYGSIHLRQRLTDIRESLGVVIDQLRATVVGLRKAGSGADDVDLAAGIEKFIQELRLRDDLKVDVAIEGDVDAAEPRVAQAVLFMAREALANVLKHADASFVEIRAAVDPQAENLRLTIMDDGVGFDVAARRPRLKQGLRNMASRASMRGGRVEVDSQPGRGTRVEILMPLVAMADELPVQEG